MNKRDVMLWLKQDAGPGWPYIVLAAGLLLFLRGLVVLHGGVDRLLSSFWRFLHP